MTNSSKNPKYLTLVADGAEMVLAEGADVEKFLNAQARGPAGSCPGPVMTRKFQTNMPRTYGALLEQLAGELGTESEAATLRAVVQAGLRALGCDLDDEE